MSKRVHKFNIAEQLWSEAYKSSHICADITEKVFDFHGRFQSKANTPENVAWLREEAANLLAVANDLKRRSKKNEASLRTCTRTPSRRFIA